MRREGFELQVGAPVVIMQEDENGKKMEPVERVTISVPSESFKSEFTTMTKGEGLISS